MAIKWFSKNLTKKRAMIPNDTKHAVLGTLLQSPINEIEEEALFACGCFWGAEKSFWKLPGVVSTAVGYAGGHLENPNYQQVCSGQTGHTEVVRVIWKKSDIDFSDLLKMFWECHDPTQGNGQGNDRGTQYRSAIYIKTENHLNLATASLDSFQKELNQKGFGTITTEIKENQKFYFAEEYHQQYLAKPGSRPYCSAMPTTAILKDFQGANYKLTEETWSHFDWSERHCVLRSSNTPIKQVPC